MNLYRHLGNRIRNAAKKLFIRSIKTFKKKSFFLFIRKLVLEFNIIDFICHENFSL